MTDETLIDVLYGFVRLDTCLTRVLPDGSLQFGCRVRTYDNRPSEPEHLVSDVTHWDGMVLSW